MLKRAALLNVYDRLRNQRNSHFSNTKENLAKANFDGTMSMNANITIPLIIRAGTEAFETLPAIFHAVTSGFFRERGTNCNCVCARSL